jgi:hypothetical protein
VYLQILTCIVLLYFFFWPLCCLVFDIPILIGSLVYLQALLRMSYFPMNTKLSRIASAIKKRHNFAKRKSTKEQTTIYKTYI